MLPGLDDLPAAGPDAIDRTRARCKYPAIENGVAAPAGERWMRGVDSDDVGARAGFQTHDGLGEGLAAALEGPVEQRASGRDAGSVRQHVALAVLEPLAIFELTQLIGNADQHIGIGADAEPATCIKEF